MAATDASAADLRIRRLRLRFHFAHAVTRQVMWHGDSYQATFGLCLRQASKLMWTHTKLLYDSEAAMNRRMRWLRERGRLAPEPKRARVKLRDRIVDLFAPRIAPAPVPS